MLLAQIVMERYYGEMWNQWRYDLVPELLSSDLKFRGSLGVSVTGHGGFLQYMQQVRSAFPDFHNRILRLDQAGSSVTAMMEYSGTHHGELFGVPPTNKRVVYEGVALFQFNQKLISEVHVMSDRLQILEQLLGKMFWRGR